VLPQDGTSLAKRSRRHEHHRNATALYLAVKSIPGDDLVTRFSEPPMDRREADIITLK
jgi:hypothetical protein